MMEAARVGRVLRPRYFAVTLMSACPSWLAISARAQPCASIHDATVRRNVCAPAHRTSATAKTRRRALLTLLRSRGSPSLVVKYVMPKTRPGLPLVRLTPDL